MSNATVSKLVDNSIATFNPFLQVHIQPPFWNEDNQSCRALGKAETCVYQTHLAIRGVLHFCLPCRFRQIRDPYRSPNIEYVASCKVTLEANGDLNMKNIGGGIPTDQLVLRNGKYTYYCNEPSIPAGTIECHIRQNDGPILTVITFNDYNEAEHRERRAEQIKFLKGLFSRACTWLPLSLCPATSSSDENQTNNALPRASPSKLKSYFSGLRSSILSCLRRKDGGGYVKLEEDMVEEKY